MVRRLFGNASSNLLQLLVYIIVTFIMAPVYLRLMGHYDYGLRELVMAVAGYMGLMTLGMRPAVTRFVAYHNARNERDAVQSVYACSIVFMFGVGLIVASVFAVWGSFFSQSLGEETHTNKYMYFLLLLSVYFCFSFPMYVTEHFLEGLQKFYLKNYINIFFTVLTAVLCYNFMTVDNALLFIVSVSIVSVVAKLLIFGSILSMPTAGNWIFRLSDFSFLKLKELIVFGSKSFVQGVAQSIHNVSDRVVIGFALGPAAVPAYTIPSTLPGYVMKFAMTTTQVFMPLFAELNAKKQLDKLQQVYLLSSKYMVSVSLAMCAGVAVVGPPFVQVWVPGEFEPHIVSALVIILSIRMAINRLAPFSRHFLMAIDKHAFLAKLLPVGAFINLGVSIVLVYQIGLLGIAWGTLISTLFVMPLTMIYTSKQLQVSVPDYFSQSILPAMLPVVLMTVAIVYFQSKWELISYFRIVLCVLIGAVTYGLAFLLLCFRNDEKTIIKKLLKK